MKKIIFFALFLLISVLSGQHLLAQTGNVGIGTTDPQAKLHVDGTVRVDDITEFKNAAGQTIFQIDAQGGFLKMFNELDEEVLSINLEEDTDLKPEIDNIKSGNFMRRQGAISIRDGNNSNLIDENGLILDDPDLETSTRLGSGFLVVEGDALGGIPNAGGATLTNDELKFEDNDGNSIAIEADPTNGKLSLNGELCVAVLKVGDPDSDKSTTVSPCENKMEDPDNGNSTTQTPDKFNVSENNKTADLNSSGIEVTDPDANLQFFNDIFGTSIFDGTNSISTAFDLFNGSFDIFANLDVSGLLSKGGGSFKIDHPLDPTNKFLYHSFVESPDMMNIYNGNITTNENGEAVVELPTYFEALNMDFRYQLTVIGSFAQAIVGQKVQNNQFVIRTNEPNIEVSWQVTGIRNDTFAQANRIQVEVEKIGEEVGQLLFDPNQAASPYPKNQQHWEKRQAFLNKNKQ